MDAKPEYGLTTVLLVERYEDLPNSCEDIIQYDGQELQLYNVSESSQLVKHIQPDYVKTEQLEMLARAVLADDAEATQPFFTHACAGSIEEMSPRPCAPAIVQR